MANIENIKIGNITYPLRDKNTLRNLTSEQAAQILVDGTYNNEAVANGEVFTQYDGTFQQYTKTSSGLPPTIVWSDMETGNKLFASDGTVLAYTNGGNVYKSTDNGATFTQTATGLPSYDNTYNHPSPFFYMANKWIIVATNAQSAYVSTDLVNWSQVVFDFGEETYIPLTSDTTRFAYNGTTYVMTCANGWRVYYSSDFEHWTKSSTSFNEFSNLGNCKCLISCGSYFYLGAHAGSWGLWRSTDNGVTWQSNVYGVTSFEKNCTLESDGVSKIIRLDSNTSGHVIAGFYYSTNNGGSWSWTTASNIFNNTSIRGADIKYSNGVWVISLGTYGGAPTVGYSTDLSHWTASTTGISAMGYGGNQLTACGDKFILREGYSGVYGEQYIYALTSLSQPALTSTTVTLTAADWSANIQTVSVTGMTASKFVWVSPDASSAADYASGGVLCTAQGDGTLTFTCSDTPSTDITVNIIFG